jgi:hypothetical protein
MKILLFHQTTDNDLKTGLKVCYKNIDGVFNNLGIITDIITDKDGIKNYLVNTAIGAYMADELKLIKQPPPKIKEANYWSIYDFAMSRNRPEMQGNKLKALFKLIEKRGEPIETKETNLNGLKALEIKPGEWVAIKRTTFGKPAGQLNGQPFYPCMLQTYLLTTL